jgi:hypothetical protein
VWLTLVGVWLYLFAWCLKIWELPSFDLNCVKSSHSLTNVHWHRSRATTTTITSGIITVQLNMSVTIRPPQLWHKRIYTKGSMTQKQSPTFFYSSLLLMTMSRVSKRETWRLSNTKERDDLGIYVISYLSCLMPGHEDNNFVQSPESVQWILPWPVNLQDIDSSGRTKIDSSRFRY